MKKVIPLTDLSLFQELFSQGEKKIKLIEKQLKVKIYLVPEGIIIEGRKDSVKKGENLLQRYIKLAKEGFAVKEEDIQANIDTGFIPQENKEVRIKVGSGRKYIFPKTPGQEEYLKAIANHDITFAIGPAGTGKTYLAMAMAVNYLLNKKVHRIILTRPAIEAGESLGFLPGGMQEKLSPYLRPLYDALYEMMESEDIESFLETGIIEIAPLAYMRGRTLNNAFIILDEAQNCTSDQLRMFLTRLGFYSKTVVTGDITQSDLPGGIPFGLNEAVEIVSKIEGIKVFYLTNKDVVRHPLTQKIIRAYESFYTEQQKKNKRSKK